MAQNTVTKKILLKTLQKVLKLKDCIPKTEKEDANLSEYGKAYKDNVKWLEKLLQNNKCLGHINDITNKLMGYDKLQDMGILSSHNSFVSEYGQFKRECKKYLTLCNKHCKELSKWRSTAMVPQSATIDSLAKRIEGKKKTLKESISALENALETLSTEVQTWIDNNPLENMSKPRSKISWALPWLVPVVVLVVGVVLGITVFRKNQDVWYFALEGIKDAIAAFASGIATEQIIVTKRGEKNRIWIPIVSSIGGIFALVLSILLYCGSDWAFVERFTKLGKVAYIGIVLALIFIAIVCSASLIYSLVKNWIKLTKNRSRKKKDKNTSNTSNDQQEEKTVDEK